MKNIAVPSLLLVTTIDGSENLAQYLSREAGLVVQVARTRRAAVALLRRDQFTVVVFDRPVVQGEEFDSMCQWTGFAVPMEMDIAMIGAARLLARLRNVLARREHETALARGAVRHDLEDTMRRQLTGVLLQSDLILRERLPEPVERRMVMLREMANQMRAELRVV